ncbi:D-alanyl-D-alanine carboxypeptidase [Actinokineospora baliensis]|uniref:hypothetical protein n=1 Tax=Actinokineospora baliensis TaxID=547056 RepID=UPI00195B3CB2|nr:hypothetical protein [Actinokineospora baliensis]MBM7772373.1 D-alanyl-D-alanine carboxypeptidase [Actinokineospora baliensis]
MRHRFLGLLAVFSLTACAAAPTASPGLQLIDVPTSTTGPAPLAAPDPTVPDPPPTVAPPQLPTELTTAVRSVQKSAKVGALVIDRDTRTEVAAVQPDRQFRSASLVKLLIAIDVLASGADAATRKRITTMLSRSDDDIASALWVRQGGAELVTRTARRLGLRATEPPGIVGRWGDVLLTARDVALVYEYVLTLEDPLIVDALAAASPKAADGFDQYFGIPDGLSAEWAVKQGWSNSTNDIVLHSTGLVGPHWRYIVVLLTEHPLRTRWTTAANSVTAAARVLDPYLH